MPGLVPGIHVLTVLQQEDVDGRVKPGHDEYVNCRGRSANLFIAAALAHSSFTIPN
jgi:hypothetical protein